MTSVLLSLAAVLPVNEAEQLLIVYQSGDAVATVQFYTELHRHPDAAPIIEAALAAQKAPPLRQVALGSRLAIVHQGLTGKVRQPDNRELAFMLDPLVEHVTRKFDAVSGDPLLQPTESQPPKLAAFTDRLWDHFAVRNRIEQLEREVAWFETVAKRLPSSQVKKLNDSLQEHLTRASVTRRVEQMESLSAIRQEWEMELRLSRLNHSPATLAREPLKTERVIAAGTWRSDQKALLSFLTSNQPQRGIFQDRMLARKIRVTAAQAKRSAGTLTGRAELLFDALFWWSRGRYGIGSHERGLANGPMDQAVQMQLMMPAERPQPVPPSSVTAKGLVATPGDESATVPHVRRRNQHWWAIGERRVEETNVPIGSPLIQRVLRMKRCVV